MNGRRRVMFVITGLGAGGAESQVLALSQSLVGRGWEVCVVSMTPIPDSLSSGHASFDLTSLSMRPGVPDLTAIAKFRKLVAAFRPTVVHSHMVHANIFARLSRIFCRMPKLICTGHSVREGGRWLTYAYRATDRLANVTTYVSESAAAEAVLAGKVPANRVRVVPNGVDVKAFAPVESDRIKARRSLGIEGEFLWINVARLVPAKDHATLINAWAIVARQKAGARLVLAGDGPLRDDLLNRIKQHGLENSIHLLGYRSDIAQLLRASDGYVSSSAWEGLPMVLLEAAAAGLPIVATDVQGNRDIVDGRGVLVTRGDAEALAGAMIALQSVSSEGRRRVAELLREKVAMEFDIDSVTSRWIQLYEQA